MADRTNGGGGERVQPHWHYDRASTLSLHLDFEIHFVVAGWDPGRLSPGADPGPAGGCLISMFSCLVEMVL